MPGRARRIRAAGKPLPPIVTSPLQAPCIQGRVHGDDDQIVPIGAAAMLASKIVKNATLKVYEGAPHGMCTTLKDRVDADLLEFIRS